MTEEQLKQEVMRVLALSEELNVWAKQHIPEKDRVSILGAVFTQFLMELSASKRAVAIVQHADTLNHVMMICAQELGCLPVAGEA
jgi:hypothetical protein